MTYRGKAARLLLFLLCMLLACTCALSEESTERKIVVRQVVLETPAPSDQPEDLTAEPTAETSVQIEAPARRAEIHINETAPEGWSDRVLLRITALKTAPCDAILMESGDMVMLIDGGTTRFAQRVLDAINDRGYDNRVNYIFNTHPHDDHIDAQTQMVKLGLRADEFLTLYPPKYNNDLHKKMVRQVEEKGIGYHQLHDMETMEFGHAHLTFYTWQEDTDPNGRSAQCHVLVGTTSVMLTADLTGKAQHHYLENYPPEAIHADILKGPHHSLVRMVGDYLTTVDPEFVFITSSEKHTVNSREQLTNRKIPFLLVDHGTITMETDGTDWYIFQVRGQM
ncbi:MAG: MBL fold metallo-hydrolase [Clostridia bacterium]|nr:MBL fold metallo-hydrolase [Clostridia bacterium]